MFGMFKSLAAGVAGLLMVASAAAAAPPLSAYGRLPDVDHVAISPDGTSLALVTGDNKSRQLQIIDLAKGTVSAFIDVTQAKVDSVSWAGPQQLVVVSSKTQYSPFFGDDKHEIATLIVRDLKRAKWTVMLDNRKDALPMVLGGPMVRMINGHPVLFFESYNFRDGYRGDWDHVMYKADLDTDSVSITELGGRYTQGWVLDDQGKAIGREDYDQEKGDWAFSVFAGGKWVETNRRKAKIDVPNVFGLSVDARSILVREGDSSDTAVWRNVSLADGSWSPEVASLKGTSSLFYDQVTLRPLGRSVPDDDAFHYEFFNPSDQAAWQKIKHAFPDEDIYLEDWTDDRSKVVVRVEGPKHGNAYFVVDLKTMHAAYLSDVYSGVRPSDINPIQRADYEAKDGLKIPAYLTLPKGREAKKLPLVILVHGGPGARDYAAFDWWTQALASRGYAVFQPQFRGSTGFGQKLFEAGFGEWGRKMQTDVDDGVHALVKQGIVDSKRVCITGASYGGYAALAGATIDPEPYRCAVAVAGVSDIRRMLREDADDRKFEQSVAQRFDLRFVGLKSAADPRADEISPIAHVDRAHMPLLLIHGQDDTTVPYEHSTEFVGAMHRAGKTVEFVTLKGEDHHLSRGETRQQMLEAMVKFLEVNNPPDPPPPPAPAKSASR